MIVWYKTERSLRDLECLGLEYNLAVTLQGRMFAVCGNSITLCWVHMWASGGELEKVGHMQDRAKQILPPLNFFITFMYCMHSVCC